VQTFIDSFSTTLRDLLMPIIRLSKEDLLQDGTPQLAKDEEILLTEANTGLFLSKHEEEQEAEE